MEPEWSSVEEPARATNALLERLWSTSLPHCVIDTLLYYFESH